MMFSEVTFNGFDAVERASAHSLIGVISRNQRSIKFSQELAVGEEEITTTRDRLLTKTLRWGIEPFS